MIQTFAELKKQRKAHSEALSAKLTEATSSGFSQDQDDRFWQPTVDKAGNGYSVIRFLPEVKGEDVPFVRLWNHGFKGPGGWYIENSLTTIGKEDPVSEYNSELWNSTNDDDSPARKQARNQKRRLQFFSNILVVEDPAHPENEGKVFVFKYGKKIFDHLNEAMNPKEVAGKKENPINPFDFWEGANFILKIRQVDGYRNYDKSSFEKPSAIFDGDDEKIEAVWNAEHPLQPFIAEDQFKSYDELKKKLEKVLGIGRKPVTQRVIENEIPAPHGKTVLSKAEQEDETPPFDTDESDDDLKFFKKLVEK